jgi:hypothetical protein
MGREGKGTNKDSPYLIVRRPWLTQCSLKRCLEYGYLQMKEKYSRTQKDTSLEISGRIMTGLT